MYVLSTSVIAGHASIIVFVTGTPAPMGFLGFFLDRPDR
jgi:hypothetical protein